MKNQHIINKVTGELEKFVVAGQMKLARVSHDALLKMLRGSDGKGNMTYPAPDWDRFPNARTFFTQEFA